MTVEGEGSATTPPPPVALSYEDVIEQFQADRSSIVWAPPPQPDNAAEVPTPEAPAAGKAASDAGAPAPAASTP